MKVIVVVPNWNGRSGLKPCLDSLLAQTLKSHVIVVDNGSTDGSAAYVEENYPGIEIIRHDSNKGYAGGVNPGFRRAIEDGAGYAAPFNNDAVADKEWLKNLAGHLDAHPEVGIATCKLMSSDGRALDSTGDYYTSWGLPYPRGRGEPADDRYDQDTAVFGASGGASLYRVSMLKQIGLLDEDFFAYYEDVDLSWRAQLAGWKVSYVPASIAYHEISTTGKKIKGFFTYQTIKNYPYLLWKNVPARLLPVILPRFFIAYMAFLAKAAATPGRRWPALKGVVVGLCFLPKKLVQRHRIQSSRKVSTEYIRSIITWDLPPNAHKLRALRSFWRRTFRRPD